MKRLLYIPLLVTILFACREDSLDSMDSATFSTITGVWKLTEVERASIDNKNIWEPVAASKSDTIIFRSDGVILNPDGSPRCCAPKSLVINGSLIDIKPQMAIPANPQCALLNCVYCPTWDLSWNDDQLIISSCATTRVKYVR